jgi:Flp pilus assembly protein TadB
MPRPRENPAMPLLRLLAINLAAGVAVALLALLGGGFIVTFASVVMGTAIWRVGREHDAPPGGGRKRRVSALAEPAPISVR